MSEPLADHLDPRPVIDSRTAYAGLVWDVRRERVDLGAAGIVERDLIAHPGAVAVLALDEEERVALIQQYRHPTGWRSWEIPAGLRDIPDEPLLACARRELAEEADLAGRDWAVLMDYFTTPGFTSEAIRIFLARGLTPIPEDERHARTGEEAGMPLRWVALDEVRAAVLAGRLHNPHTVIAVLTAYALRADGWRDLRPVTTDWPLQAR